ncbi:unnamed protein product [Lymnaea stagnalis]|uniref:Hexosyltransferase n=1 Tax=Lymnaea stagnalis TaxID=6523 RepID=A0AAV2I078_LYMST
MLFRRSFNLEIFKIFFGRWTLISIVFSGCFLFFLMSMSTSPKTKTTRDVRFIVKQTTSKNSTDTNTYSWKNVQDIIFQPKASSSPTPEIPSDRLLWQQAGFPEGDANPSLVAILDMFHSKMSQRGRKLVNPHSYRYIHNVPNACVGRKVELIVGVPTRTSSFEARQAIRESWAQYANDPSNNAVVLFFLGVQSDKAGQEQIDAEALKCGDIVQEDFEDTYRNLSLKSVALVKWVSVYCPESTFTLKADDDMYVNMPRLLVRLRQQLSRGPLFLLGAIHQNTAPFRDKKNKWAVTRDEYPDKLFPNYLSGTAYAMTSTAAMRLYLESLYVSFLFLEDVYLTGLVADQAAVPRVADSDFNWAKYEADGCKFRDKISGHKNTPEEIRKIHKELFDPNLRCAAG